jgi:hypothetical protein
MKVFKVLKNVVITFCIIECLLSLNARTKRLNKKIKEEKEGRLSEFYENEFM